MKGKSITLLISDMSNSSIVVNAANAMHFKQLGTETDNNKKTKPNK